MTALGPFYPLAAVVVSKGDAVRVDSVEASEVRSIERVHACLPIISESMSIFRVRIQYNFTIDAVEFLVACAIILQKFAISFLGHLREFLFYAAAKFTCPKNSRLGSVRVIRAVLGSQPL